MCVSVSVMAVSVEVAVCSVPPPSFVKWTSGAAPLWHASQRIFTCVSSTASAHGPFVTNGVVHMNPPPPPAPPPPPLPAAPPVLVSVVTEVPDDDVVVVVVLSVLEHAARNN